MILLKVPYRHEEDLYRANAIRFWPGEVLHRKNPDVGFEEIECVGDLFFHRRPFPDRIRFASPKGSMTRFQIITENIFSDFFASGVLKFPPARRLKNEHAVLLRGKNRCWTDGVFSLYRCL